MDSYSESHLFVAAIRVMTFKNDGPPTLEDVCGLVDFSLETGHALCRSLKKLQVIETMEDPFSIKLAIANHLELEIIPQKEAEKTTLADELAKFQAKKNDMDQKVSSIQEEIKQKKKDLFAGIDAKFKEELEKFQK